MAGMNMDVKDLVHGLQLELNEVVQIVKEKGASHFNKAFAISGGIVFGIYALMYQPTLSKLEMLASQTSAARAKASQVEKYEKVRFRLRKYYLKLPKPKDRQGWLFNSILKSANEQGITLKTIGSQRVVPERYFQVLTIPVKVDLTYAQLGQWVESLENTKPTIFVSRVSIEKRMKVRALDDPEAKDRGPGLDDWGIHEMGLEVSTIVPKKIRVF